MKISLLLCFLAFMPGLAWADKQLLREQIAKQYFGLLLAGDYQQMGLYLNDSSVLEDRTAGKTYKGKRDITRFFMASTKGMTNYRFDMDRFFISKKVAVFIGTYVYLGSGALFGKQGQELELFIPAVTVLTVDEKENKITKHQDFFDYQEMKRQLE